MNLPIYNYGAIGSSSSIPVGDHGVSTLFAVSRAYGLSGTESEIISHLPDASSPTDIANELEVPVRDIKAHLRSIYTKTGERGFKKTRTLVCQFVD